MLSDFLFQLKFNPLYRLEGATLRRHLTQVNFLESGPDAFAPVRELPPQIYQIEQLENETPSAAQFILSSPFDLDGATLPNRPALRTCPYRYRDPDTCGYTGSEMFTRANQPIFDPAQDICNKGLTACELRHPFGLLPHGGFVGLGGF
jgi:lambda family phage minor tail protein L